MYWYEHELDIIHSPLLYSVFFPYGSDIARLFAKSSPKSRRSSKITHTCARLPGTSVPSKDFAVERIFTIWDLGLSGCPRWALLVLFSVIKTILISEIICIKIWGEKRLETCCANRAHKNRVGACLRHCREMAIPEYSIYILMFMIVWNRCVRQMLWNNLFNLN